MRGKILHRKDLSSADNGKFNELLPYFKEADDEYLSEYHMNGKCRRGLRAYTMYVNSPLRCM
jgi:hypothetical protein